MTSQTESAAGLRATIVATNGMPNSAADAVANLRLRCWHDVQDLVMVRLVDRDRAGPLARAVPCDVGPPGSDGAGRASRSTARNDLCFDIGVAAADGAVRLTPKLVASWGCDPSAIWDRALANTEQQLTANLGVASVGDLSIHLLSGGLFTTGVLAVNPSTLDRLGVPRDQAVGARSRRRIGALAPSTIVVFDPLAQANHGPDADDALGQSFRVHLAALFPDRLRPNLFRHVPAGAAELTVQGSFPWIRILE